MAEQATRGKHPGAARNLSCSSENKPIPGVVHDTGILKNASRRQLGCCSDLRAYPVGHRTPA